ncbi:MAG: hypothetical protein AAB914_03885 [Patescibacteria group bacterium]
MTINEPFWLESRLRSKKKALDKARTLFLVGIDMITWKQIKLEIKTAWKLLASFQSFDHPQSQES